MSWHLAPIRASYSVDRCRPNGTSACMCGALDCFSRMCAHDHSDERVDSDEGHSVLLASNAYTIYNAIARERSWDMVRDFDGVILANLLPFFLVIQAEAVPVGSVGELIAYLKARPGQLSYFTPGVGSPHHLAMELFKLQTGIDVVHIPYKGMGPGMVDFLAGRVHMTITGYPAIAKHVGGGKVKILATADSARAGFRPDIPTLAESGVPGAGPSMRRCLRSPGKTSCRSWVSTGMMIGPKPLYG